MQYITLHPAVLGEVTTATIATIPATQLQPPFGQSVDSLCHPWFTTTNVSYRFPILKLPPPPCAVLLVYYLSVYLYSYLIRILSYRIFQWIGLIKGQITGNPIFHRTNKGFRLRFSLKPIHRILSSALRSSPLSYPFHWRVAQANVESNLHEKVEVEGQLKAPMPWDLWDAGYGSRSERRKSQIGWSIFLGK